MQCTLFPHDSIRDQQDQLIDGVLRTIDSGGILVAHAPTGLGKTAATLAPAIERAIALNKLVVFMTSRLTQHALALETVQRIRNKHNIAIPVVDLVGKKHFCLQPGADRLTGKEFAEYCRAMREDGLCEHYERLRQGEQLSPTTKSVLVQLGKTAPHPPERVKMVCSMPEHRLCPYEITMLMAKDARVIITDYSYIFNEGIRDSFLARINRELGDCILVVDEGHNLPERVKDLATERITSMTIRRAMTELVKFKHDEHKHHLQEFSDLLAKLAQGTTDERYVTREELMEGLARSCPVDRLVDDLSAVAQLVREEQKSSSAGAIADFLSAWNGDDKGFARILYRRSTERMSDRAMQGSREQDDDATPVSLTTVRTTMGNTTPTSGAGRGDFGSGQEGRNTLFGGRAETAETATSRSRGYSGFTQPKIGTPQTGCAQQGSYTQQKYTQQSAAPLNRYGDSNVEVRYRCLDPSIITKPVLEGAHSAIIMSGTLTPTAMFADLLGVPGATSLTLTSPFPQHNRLNIVVPKTTTKYATRSETMYDEIAAICGRIVDAVPGNSAVFFPSYQLLDEIKRRFEHKCHRTVFTEHPSFTREEREELLGRFKGYKTTGAVLLGVMGGSFSEGIDLPGDELRTVVIVGLPLSRPDLETKALIDYCQERFGKGWDYGYTFPAFNKTLQSAGRCIRTETDRGAIIFLDERYAWQSYYQCFPNDWQVRISLKYEELLKNFFTERLPTTE